MKNKKILSLLLSCAVTANLTGCSPSEKSEPDTAEEYYTVSSSTALSYDLAYADDIRSADGNIYVCGYSYITNQNSVFSLYDSVSGSLDEISVQSSETGDVTAVYLGDDRFYAGYRNGRSSWFCIYDVKTGSEIKKIPVEDNMRIASFFEDSKGGIIIDIRDTFGFGYIEKCSAGYTMTGKISIYDQISSRNMKILDMIYCNGCFWVVAEENSVSEEKINVFRVSEDGTLNESFYGAVPESDERYLTSFINSDGNLCIVSRDKSDRAQVTVSEIQLSDGRIVNSYYDEINIDSIVQTDMISDISDFIYTDSGNVFSYKTEEQKKTSQSTVRGTLLYASDRGSRMLFCSNVYEDSEHPVIYQYDTDGKLTGEFRSDMLDMKDTALKSDVLSGGNICTLFKDSGSNYYAVWSDFKGNVLNKTAVSDGNNCTGVSIQAGADDELYCTWYDGESDTYSLEVYNSSARKTRSFSEIDSVKTIKDIFPVNGNDFILYTDDSDETGIRPAGEVSSGESFEFSLPEADTDIEKIFTCSDGSLYCFDADNLYRITGNDFAGEKIISWSSCGIVYRAEAVCIPDDDRIVCFTSGNGYTLTILERADEQMKEKLKNQKVITVGGVSISGVNFTEAVEKFNSEHPEYRVCISDYIRYNGKDPDECISKFNLDMVSGKIPDIFIGSDSFDLKFYAEKELFCDLDVLADSDEEFQRTDYLENIFDCYKSHGKQYYVPVNYFVYAVFGKESFLGSENGWTEDEFFKIAGDKNMFYNPSVYSLCEALLFSNLSNYVDWENKKCSFTDGRFEKTAGYIYDNGVPEDEYKYYLDYPEDSDGYRDYFRRFSDNLCYAEFSVISSATGLASLQNGTLNNEKIVLKGIPSASASGPLVYARTTAAVSSASENKDGAWLFVKTLLSDEYQTKSTSINSLPVKKSAFDNIISNSNRSGFGYRTDGTFYETAPLSDDDVSEFAEVVKNINNVYSCDSRIRDIMHESLDEYFSGRIKVNEAAERIQNKVSLYLDEIR